MEILKLLVRVITYVLIMFILISITGCDSGWSVCGWEVK